MRSRHSRTISLPRATMVLLALLLLLAPAVAAQEGADVAYSPGSGTAQVIAQGVAPLPAGDVVWRTVRSTALPLETAPFEVQPLGFVLATDGPILLTDETGRQVHLGRGEAALTAEGVVQQRASLSGQEGRYLSIELVPVDAPPPANGAIVLQPGAPFPAPTGAHDLNLLADLLGSGESLTIPDSGGKNVILVTDGAAQVGKPDGGSAVLLAGEAASFSGDLLVEPAPSGGAAADRAGFVVAIIGPVAPMPTLPASASAPQPPTTPAPAATAEPATAGSGSITIAVFDCPPGMTAATFDAAACAPSEQDFDITISGPGLPTPLTVADATVSGETLAWTDLPLGEFVIAEAVLPLGYTDYGLAARGATGSSALGYRVALDDATPDLAARIYNFTGE